MKIRLIVVAVVIAGGATACSSTDSSDRAADTTTVLPTTTTTEPPVVGPVTLTAQKGVSPLYGQGVARIPRGWVFSGRNTLWRTDDQITEIRKLAPAIPPAWSAKGFDHVGDIDVVGEFIYAPLEQPQYENGVQATARIDRDTLRFVDAVEVKQNENSFVSVDGATMTAYSMDRFDDNALLRYDVANGWKPLPPLPLSMVLQHAQGGDLAHGALWISTDDPIHGLYRVDLATGTTEKIGTMGHAGGEGEGIDATPLASGLLHTLCVDKTYVPVWFAHFRARTSG